MDKHTFAALLDLFCKKKRDGRLGSIPNIIVVMWSDPTMARTNMQVFVRVKLAEDGDEESFSGEEEDRRVGML